MDKNQALLEMEDPPLKRQKTEESDASYCDAEKDVTEIIIIKDNIKNEEIRMDNCKFSSLKENHLQNVSDVDKRHPKLEKFDGLFKVRINEIESLLFDGELENKFSSSGMGTVEKECALLRKQADVLGKNLSLFLEKVRKVAKNPVDSESKQGTTDYSHSLLALVEAADMSSKDVICQEPAMTSMPTIATAPGVAIISNRTSLGTQISFAQTDQLLENKSSQDLHFQSGHYKTYVTSPSIPQIKEVYSIKDRTSELMRKNYPHRTNENGVMIPNNMLPEKSNYTDHSLQFTSRNADALNTPSAFDNVRSKIHMPTSNGNCYPDRMAENIAMRETRFSKDSAPFLSPRNTMLNNMTMHMGEKNIMTSSNVIQQQMSNSNLPYRSKSISDFTTSPIFPGPMVPQPDVQLHRNILQRTENTDEMDRRTNLIQSFDTTKQSDYFHPEYLQSTSNIRLTHDNSQVREAQMNNMVKQVQFIRHEIPSLNFHPPLENNQPPIHPNGTFNCGNYGSPPRPLLVRENQYMAQSSRPIEGHEVYNKKEPFKNPPPFQQIRKNQICPIATVLPQFRHPATDHYRFHGPDPPLPKLVRMPQQDLLRRNNFHPDYAIRMPEPLTVINFPESIPNSMGHPHNFPTELESVNKLNNFNKNFIRPLGPSGPMGHPGPIIHDDHGLSPNHQFTVPRKDILFQMPRLQINVTVSSIGVILTWDFETKCELDYSRILEYKLFAAKGFPNPPPLSKEWIKLGKIKARPLPMSCSLSTFVRGLSYHFIILAVDIDGKEGPLSNPCSVKLN